jgi:hypothetical protein
VVTKTRCPHTGVVNFFSKADPLFAVGSVCRASRPTDYVWRCYLDDQEAGVAADISIAEAHLRNAIARGHDTKPGMI